MVRGLLGRLASRDPSRSVDDLASVFGNLHSLLNTREGDAPAVPDFGILDLSDLIHNFPDASQYVQKSIRDTILKYEPRLTSVRVRAVESADPLKLAFEISARLEAGARASRVHMRTEISAQGRASVKR